MAPLDTLGVWDMQTCYTTLSSVTITSPMDKFIKYHLTNFVL